VFVWFCHSKSQLRFAESNCTLYEGLLILLVSSTKNGRAFRSASSTRLTSCPCNTRGLQFGGGCIRAMIPVAKKSSGLNVHSACGRTPFAERQYSSNLRRWKPGRGYPGAGWSLMRRRARRFVTGNCIRPATSFETHDGRSSNASVPDFDRESATESQPCTIQHAAGLLFHASIERPKRGCQNIRTRRFAYPHRVRTRRSELCGRRQVVS